MVRPLVLALLVLVMVGATYGGRQYSSYYPRYYTRYQYRPTATSYYNRPTATSNYNRPTATSYYNPPPVSNNRFQPAATLPNYNIKYPCDSDLRYHPSNFNYCINQITAYTAYLQLRNLYSPLAANSPAEQAYYDYFYPYEDDSPPHN